MRAFEAGSLLLRLARGGDVALGPHELELLRVLVYEGLLNAAPDVSAELAELMELRVLLAASPPPAQDKAIALRARALELVEIVSGAQGAARVAEGAVGPYRAGGGARHYVLSFRARSLLSDLAPRLGRVGHMTLEELEAHLRAVREVFAHRAQRALELDGLLRGPAAELSVSEGARRSAAVGLSVRNEPARMLVATWSMLVKALLELDKNDGTGRSEWTPDQESAAAEGVILATRDLRQLSARSAALVHEQRLALLGRYTQGNAEDALDATMILAAMGDVLTEAAELARAAQSYGTPLPLSAALIARASPSPDAAGLVAQLRARLQRLGEGADEHERTYAAALLTLGGADPAALVDRARDVRAYLGRFSATGTLVPAALLALLPVELPELLDLLRMVSAELQKQRIGAGGAESLSLSIKLLLATALLARGDEGDPEERVGLLRFDTLAASQLGVAGLVSQVPLSFSALTAFHRPTLDAVLFYQEAFQPTHSPYVFGTGSGYRSSGWG